MKNSSSFLPPADHKSLIKNKLWAVFSGGFILCLFIFTNTARAQLSGSYTIDAGKIASAVNYKDFHSAIADLDSGVRYDGGTPNGKGVNGPVIFTAANGTYNESNELTNIPGSSPSNTVTFTSADSTATKVVLNYNRSSASSAAFVLKISGASNVRFDHITVSFNITYIGVGPMSIIYLSNAVSNFTLYRCRIIETDGLKQPYTGYAYGVFSSQGGTVPDSNKKFYNNFFKGVANGFYFTANSKNTGTSDRYTIIRGNTADSIAYTFLKGTGQEQIAVQNNIVNAYLAGISLRHSLNIKEITGNDLYLYSGTCIEIDTSTCLLSTQSLIANNALRSNNGIFMYLDTGFNIYHNNIYGYAAYNGQSAGLRVQYCSGISLINNNVAAIAEYGGRCIIIDTLSKKIKSDYNNFYATDSIAANSPYFFTGMYYDLSAWQKATGYDLHSISVNPGFHFYTFPRTRNKALMGKGFPVSVSTDIDGVLRSMTATSIGANEIADTVSKGLAGNYTINKNGAASDINYRDFHSAIADLDSGIRYDGGYPNGEGVTGKVFFKVYQIDKQQNTITAIPGSSDANSVTFSGYDSLRSGLSYNLTNSPAGSSVLALSNASNIYFDQLSFQADGTPGTGHALYFYGGNTNISIRRCNIITNSSSAGANGISFYADNVAVKDSNINISHNYFLKNNIGIFFTGKNDSIFHTHINITGNTFDSVNNTAIQLSGTAESGIDSNHIIHGGRIFGVTAYRCRNLGGIYGNVFNSGLGIYLDSTVNASASPLLIADNVFNVSSCGIALSYSSYTNIYHNSIYVSATGQELFFRIGAIIYHSSDHVRFVNNIVQAAHGAVSVYADDLTYFNYNDYWYADSIGYYKGVKIHSFSDWQAATAMDTMSLNVNPVFKMFKDLRISNKNLEGKGISLASVKYDITGAARNTAAPTMGAYEKSEAPGLAGIYTINPASAASATNYQTFTSAFSDLDSGKRYDGGPVNGDGITGPVVFRVSDGTYLYSGNLVLGAVRNTSADNTITFTNTGGSDSTKVNLQTKCWVNNSVGMQLVNVSYIIFKRISFSQSTSCPNIAIEINNCSHIQINGCRIIAGYKAIESYIYGFNNLSDPRNYPLYNRSISVINCNVTAGAGGGFDFTNAVSQTNDEIVITGCKFSAPTATTFITMQNINGITITNNTQSSSGYYFISLYTCKNIHEISRNTCSGIFLDNCVSDSAHPANIVNNNMGSFAYSGFSLVSCSNCGYVNFLYNTINYKISDTSFYAFQLQNCTKNSIVIKDNCIISPGPVLNTNDTSCFKSLDYNNYLSRSKRLMVCGSSSYNSLSAWQSKYGLDKRSISVDPLLSGIMPALKGYKNNGVPVAEVKTDFYGRLRSSTAPTIGAYEVYGILHKDDTTICKGSCAQISSPLAGLKYAWSTGDTGKTITYCPKKQDSVTLTVYRAADTLKTTFTVYLTASACVWPGDADDNGKADMNDLLNIGVAYGDTGAKRPNATDNWNAEECKDWRNTFKSGANHKHADCNGDGVADSFDKAVILKNFGKTHKKGSGSGNPSDPSLFVSFTKDSVSTDDTLQINLNLGTNSNPVKDIYGVCFSIAYDQALGKSAEALQADLSKCWLGTPGKDMIYMMYNDSSNDILYIGFTRIDHKNVSGYGLLGELNIIMPADVAGKRELSKLLNFTVSDVRAITAEENDVPLYAIDNSILFYEFTGIRQGSAFACALHIYPNPASNVIHVVSQSEIIKSIRICNMLGETVNAEIKAGVPEADIPLAGMAAGIYTMYIETEHGSSVLRFIKQ